MKLIPIQLATCLLALAPVLANAQTPAPASPSKPSAATTPFNRTAVFLDPAHGGLDAGSRIAENILEKDVTLAFAFRLRSLLAARGFNITVTRDNDTPTQPGSPGTPLSLDDRAGIANHAHPVACLLLHATGSGTGVHLYTSELDPAPGEVFGAPWLTAQAAWVAQSRKLQKSLGQGFTRANIPLVLSQASVRPVDSLTCPAIVIELAPSTADVTSINDATYQQHVAEVVATALVFWQNTAQPPDRLNPDGTLVTPPVPAAGVKP